MRLVPGRVDLTTVGIRVLSIQAIISVPAIRMRWRHGGLSRRLHCGAGYHHHPHRPGGLAADRRLVTGLGRASRSATAGEQEAAGSSRDASPVRLQGTRVLGAARHPWRLGTRQFALVRVSSNSTLWHSRAARTAALSRRVRVRCDVPRPADRPRCKHLEGDAAGEERAALGAVAAQPA